MDTIKDVKCITNTFSPVEVKVHQDDGSVSYVKKKYIETPKLLKQTSALKKYNIIVQYPIEVQLNIMRDAIIEMQDKLGLENSNLKLMHEHITNILKM